MSSSSSPPTMTSSPFFGNPQFQNAPIRQQPTRIESNGAIQIDSRGTFIRRSPTGNQQIQMINCKVCNQKVFLSHSISEEFCSEKCQSLQLASEMGMMGFGNNSNSFGPPARNTQIGQMENNGSSNFGLSNNYKSPYEVTFTESSDFNGKGASYSNSFFCQNSNGLQNRNIFSSNSNSFFAPKNNISFFAPRSNSNFGNGVQTFPFTSFSSSSSSSSFPWQQQQQQLPSFPIGNPIFPPSAHHSFPFNSGNPQMIPETPQKALIPAETGGTGMVIESSGSEKKESLCRIPDCDKEAYTDEVFGVKWPFCSGKCTEKYFKRSKRRNS